MNAAPGPRRLAGGGAVIEQVASTGDKGIASFAGAQLSTSERPELTEKL